jgi:DNA-binding FadR family transcriptional regulator
MNDIYQQIRPQKVPEEIVRQIKSLIKEGKLIPGEKLPPERTLSDRLGVGRSSLREAINILETLGFIEIRVRKGIYVRNVSRPISDPLRQILVEDKSKLYELYEFRKDIEMASIQTAALRRTRADLVRIRRALEKMEGLAPDDHVSLLLHDQEFHLTVAQATHNFLRVHILKNIFDLVGDHMNLIIQGLLEEKSGIAPVLAQHRCIFHSIQAKDPETARSCMDDHLTWVEEKWKRFGGREKEVSSPAKQHTGSTLRSDKQTRGL